MLGEARNYPLTVVFSGGTGNHFVAHVDIRVRDAAGNTVPAGKYVIDAGYRDKTLTRRTELAPERATRPDFHWQEAG